MNKKGGTYWHVTSGTPRKWTKLGDEWPIALRRYADIEGTKYPENDVTFKAIAERYRREIFPTKAARTQRDNEKELEKLVAVFGEGAIDDIKPHHVRKFLDERGQTAKVRANRERALLSHVFNHARAWGYTSASNPCAGVKGHREIGRDRYVEDDEFRAVLSKAHFAVQDAMELAYYTAQRPGDVIRFKRSDVHEGELLLTQGKTGKKLRITIEGNLAEVIERILARPDRIKNGTLIQDEGGRPISYSTLRSRFDAARTAAKVNFQFRDIRAKAATDLPTLALAQKLLGHRNRAMTERYTRPRKGEAVAPLTRAFVEENPEIVETS